MHHKRPLSQPEFVQFPLDLDYPCGESKEFISIEKMKWLMNQYGIHLALDLIENLTRQINYAVHKQVQQPVKTIRGARSEILLYWDTWGVTKSEEGQIKAWERDIRNYVGLLSKDEEVEYLLRLVVDNFSSVATYRVWIRNFLHSFQEQNFDAECKHAVSNRDLIIQLADSLVGFYGEDQALANIVSALFSDLSNSHQIARLAKEFSYHKIYGTRVLQAALKVPFPCKGNEHNMLMLYGKMWQMIPSENVDYEQISSGKALLIRFGISQNGRNRLWCLNTEEMYQLSKRFPTEPDMARPYLNEINLALQIKDQLLRSSNHPARLYISPDIVDTIVLTAFLRHMENSGYATISNTKLRLMLTQLRHNPETLDRICKAGMDDDDAATNARSTSIKAAIQLLQLYRNELFLPQLIHEDPAVDEYTRFMIDNDDLGWMDDGGKELIEIAQEDHSRVVVHVPNRDLVTDWFLATNPVMDKKRMRLGWKHLEKLAENWHANNSNEYSWVLDYPDWSCIMASKIADWSAALPPNFQYQLVPLTTPTQLIEESISMRHCVASYVEYCVSGKVRIFSVRDSISGLRIATTELRKNNSKWEVVQIKGKHNQEMIQHIRVDNDPMCIISNAIVVFYNQQHGLI